MADSLDIRSDAKRLDLGQRGLKIVFDASSQEDLQTRFRYWVKHILPCLGDHDRCIDFATFVYRTRIAPNLPSDGGTWRGATHAEFGYRRHGLAPRTNNVLETLMRQVYSATGGRKFAKVDELVHSIAPSALPRGDSVDGPTIASVLIDHNATTGRASPAATRAYLVRACCALTTLIRHGVQQSTRPSVIYVRFGKAFACNITTRSNERQLGLSLFDENTVAIKQFVREFADHPDFAGVPSHLDDCGKRRVQLHRDFPAVEACCATAQTKNSLYADIGRLVWGQLKDLHGEFEAIDPMAMTDADVRRVCSESTVALVGNAIERAREYAMCTLPILVESLKLSRLRPLPPQWLGGTWTVEEKARWAAERIGEPPSQIVNANGGEKVPTSMFYQDGTTDRTTHDAHAPKSSRNRLRRKSVPRFAIPEAVKKPRGGLARRAMGGSAADELLARYEVAIAQDEGVAAWQERVSKCFTKAGGWSQGFRPAQSESPRRVSKKRKFKHRRLRSAPHDPGTAEATNSEGSEPGDLEGAEGSDSDAHYGDSTAHSECRDDDGMPWDQEELEVDIVEAEFAMTYWHPAASAPVLVNEDDDGVAGEAAPMA